MNNELYNLLMGGVMHNMSKLSQKENMKDLDNEQQFEIISCLINFSLELPENFKKAGIIPEEFYEMDKEGFKQFILEIDKHSKQKNPLIEDLKKMLFS